MKKSIKIVLNFTLLSLLCISCDVTRIIPDKPVSGNFAGKPELQSSIITLPFEIDIKEIENIVNKKLPKGEIASDSRRVSNTKKYSYKIYRNKNVKVSANKNEVIFKVPIDIKARGSYTACAGFWRDGDCCSTPNPFGSGCATSGIRSTENGDASPTVDVELRIKLEIKEDYSVKAKTYLKGVLTENTHLRIDLIGNLIRINIDIKDKLEKPLQDFVKESQKELDKKVSELIGKYNIKKEANKYWNEIQKPIALDEFYLNVKPESIFLENLNAKNNKLRVGLGVKSYLELSDQKPSSSPTLLPNLTLKNQTKGEFNLYIPASAKFNSIKEKGLKEVIGKTYKKNDISVTINDVNIEGVNLNNTNLFLIKLNVSGKAKFKRFKGDLYFLAQPKLDFANKLVAIEDFKIEPNTNSFLINKGLPFLTDKFYYEKIKEELKYDFTEDYNKYFKLLNQEIKELKFDNLIVNGKLNKLEIPEFYIDNEQITIPLTAKGILKSSIKLK